MKLTGPACAFFTVVFAAVLAAVLAGTDPDVAPASPGTTGALPPPPAGGAKPTPPPSGTALASAPAGRAAGSPTLPAGLDPTWLHRHGLAPGSRAAQRLVRLQDPHFELDGAADQPLLVGPGADAFAPQAASAPVLAAQQRYIHARLPAPLPGKADAVLVRWRSLDSGELLELAAQALPPVEQRELTVWRFHQFDWPPGRYRIELISADARLRLLAAANFEIAQPGASLTPFSYPLTR